MVGKKRSLWLIVVLLLVLPLLAAACGGDDDDDDGNGANLNQTYTGMGVTVKSPDGWVVQVMLGNKSDIFELEADAPPREGDFVLMVMPTPLAAMGDNVEARAAFEMVSGMMTSESEGGGGTSEIQDIKVGDKDAYRVDLEADEESDGFMIGFGAGDALIVVAGISAEGKIGDFEDVAMQIAETIEYAAPAE
jgi:hypothetical protein